MATSIIDLWKSSSLIQGTMALTSLAAIVYLTVTGKPIPDVLVGVLMSIIGYYFGTKERTK